MTEVDSIHVRRTSTIIEPDLTRVLLRPFTPGDSQRVARIIERIMSLPEDQVAVLLAEVSAEFSERHQHIRKLFLERFEQVREMLAAGSGTLRTKAAVDRLLFPGRILLGSRGAVQSLHRPAPRSNGPASGRFAIHSQPACYRRRAYFFHHVSNRNHPSRSSD